jgi:hypothetical protein
MKTIKIYQGNYEKDGKNFACYKATGKVMGKEVEVDLVPKDVGGYQLLEIVFQGKKEVDLVPVINKFTIDGREIESTKYFATTADKDGVVYQLEVIPRLNTGKVGLEWLTRE